MNKHKIIHAITILIILLLLLLLFYERTGRYAGPDNERVTRLLTEPSAPAAGALPPRLALRLYPREKMIAFPPSEFVFPWILTLPKSTRGRPPAAAASPNEGTQLTLEQQKALFYELSFTELKAARDGVQLDPSFGKTYLTYVYRWNSIYREAAREKYGINEKQLERIYETGISERWPIYR